MGWFFEKQRPKAYTTPGNPSKGHVGRDRILDDGTVYAYCTCGYTATGRGEVWMDPRMMLSQHITNTTRS